MGNSPTVEEMWASTQNELWTNIGKNPKQNCEQMRWSILKESGVKTLKIYMIGEKGGGKSSLGNGIISAIKGEEYVSSCFSAANWKRNVTSGFHFANNIGGAQLIDVQGLSEDNTLSKEFIRELVFGRVSSYTELTKCQEKMSYSDLENQEAVCVVFVLKHGDEISSDIKNTLKYIMELSGNGDLSYTVVLTHVDELDNKFRNTRKLPEVFNSKAVQKAVFDIQRELGVPPASISVVRNYFLEPTTNPYSDTLLLRALKTILSSVRGQAVKLADREGQTKC